jgi:hypothetical protein
VACALNRVEGSLNVGERDMIDDDDDDDDDAC